MRSTATVSLAFLSLATAAEAQIVVLVPDRDSTIDASFTDGSNGRHPELSAGLVIDLPTRGLVRFDVGSAVPAGSVVEHVALELHLARTLNVLEPHVCLHRALDAWGESDSNSSPFPGFATVIAQPGDATWTHRLYPDTLWGQPGGDFVTQPSATQLVGTEAGVDIVVVWTGAGLVADVQRWVDSPAENHGWFLIGDEVVPPSGSWTARGFSTREESDFEPKLTIRYAPAGTTSFCDGSDGSLASCPCANPGDPDTGCAMPNGLPGVRLDVLRQETGPNNRATLRGSGFPGAPNTPITVLVRASGLDPATPVVFGDGLRCVGIPVTRLAATFGLGGTSTYTFGHGPTVGPGTFYYQALFQNTPAVFCTPSAFNWTSGRTLDW